VLKNIWVPISGQIAQQRKVETIANNVANANTTGFKKDDVIFKEHLTALEKGVEDIDIPRKEFSPEDFYRTQGGQHAFVEVEASFANFEQGQLVPTNNYLDVALNGPGFLEVLTPNGIRYTRKGNLTIDSEGSLVTEQGYHLLSAVQNSEPGRSLAGMAEASSNIESRKIKIPNNQKVSIDLKGNIRNGEQQLATLSVVEFKDVHALRKEGNSLFINNDEANTERSISKTGLNQGFLEGSNVNAIYEMSELIKAHRHFDSIQKAINAYDSISGKAVNDIAKF
jgi:flagellar basal-body rod protein FlgF